MQGIHRGPVNSPHKWPVTRKMFPFNDVIMRQRVSAFNPEAVTNIITPPVYKWNLAKSLCLQQPLKSTNAQEISHYVKNIQRLTKHPHVWISGIL